MQRATATIGVDELATQMGISRPKAYELANSDGFPIIRVGRRIRIPVASFEKWLEDQASERAQLVTKGG